jgi:4-amino-4-deoxy-L-arabinose transferase-like glycosyltransferase
MICALGDKRRIFRLLEKRFSKIYPQKWVQIAFLLGFCFVLYFFNLGRWDLWNPDEPRYAQIAREMVNGGDWILMHFNGGVYGDKPPLFFWLIALSSYLWQGFTSFSVRFPSALFGTLTVLLTFFLGERLYSSRTGFFSGLILATSLHFAHLSTRANIDVTLTFFTTASLLCFFLWYPYSKKEGIHHNQTIRNLLIYGFYVSMAFATLAKGPIGFILPLLVSLIYLLIQKDYKEIKRMKLLLGIPLFLAIVLAWYLPAVFLGGKTYLEENLFRHTTQAYGTGWTHPRPLYYYFYNFPLSFFPWTFFLPAAIVYGCSKMTIGKRKGFLFLLAWCLVIFTFFSLSKSKRALYLLPLYPAASLMVGKFWSDFISHPLDQFRRGWITFPLYGFIGLGLIAGAATPWVVSIKFPSYLLYSLPIVFLLFGGSMVMLIFCRFKNYRAILFLLIGIMVAGYFYAFRVIFPLANPQMSARFISEEITSRIQPGDKLAIYGGLGTDPYNYYTGVVPILRFDNREAFLDLIGSSEKVFCLLKFRDFSQLFSKEGEPKVQLIARRKVRNDDVVLISNR